MTDIKLTPDGDLALVDGDLTIIDGADAIRQHLRVRLAMCRGEWFLDRNEGVHYFERVLRKPLRRGVLASVFREAILGTPGIQKLDRLDFDVDPTSRTLTVRFSATAEDGTVQMEAESLEWGPIPALAGTLTVIDTPVGGWNGVSNPEDARLGRLLETDEELRLRREKLLRGAGAGTLDSLSSDIYHLDGVQCVRVFENPTHTLDTNGLLPHSIKALVIGGDDAAIAQAIWKAKPAGTGTHGIQQHVVHDSTGKPHTVRFSRPEVIPVCISLEISTDGRWPDDGEELIQEEVERCNERFTIGQDAVASHLYAAMHTVPGLFSIDKLLLGVRARAGAEPSYGSVVTIPDRQIARFHIEAIDIQSRDAPA